MNALVLIAIVLLAVSTSAQDTRNGLPVVYGYTSGQRCPAERFYNDCNSCGCSGGFNAACTRIGCPDPQPGTDASKPLYAPDYNEGDVCPANYFYDGCNRCSCLTGSASCTKIFCEDSNRV